MKRLIQSLAFAALTLTSVQGVDASPRHATKAAGDSIAAQARQLENKLESEQIARDAAERRRYPQWYRDQVLDAALSRVDVMLNIRENGSNVYLSSVHKARPVQILSGGFAGLRQGEGARHGMYIHMDLNNGWSCTTVPVLLSVGSYHWWIKCFDENRRLQPQVFID